MCRHNTTVKDNGTGIDGGAIGGRVAWLAEVRFNSHHPLEARRIRIKCDRRIRCQS